MTIETKKNLSTKSVAQAIPKIDQLSSKPPRMGVRAMWVKQEQAKFDSVRSDPSKFPVMGVNAKMIKASKKKSFASQYGVDMTPMTIDNVIEKDLTPFLDDSCDFDVLLPEPVVLSSSKADKFNYCK